MTRNEPTSTGQPETPHEQRDGWTGLAYRPALPRPALIGLIVAIVLLGLMAYAIVSNTWA